MIKYTIFALAFAVSSASAITIQMGKGLAGGVNVTTEGSAPLPGGYTIRIGTYDADPAANSSFAQLQASFKEFSVTTSPTSGASSGLITAADSTSVVFAASAQNAPTFNGKSIYFLIGDTNAYGVIKGQTPSATSWTFPADTSGTASVNAIASSAAAFIPVVGKEIDNASGADTLVLVGAIPEPSVGLLSVLGLGLLIKRRR